MALTDLEFLQGALTLATVIVSVILGFSIMVRYKKGHMRELIFVGATWILLVSGYWPDAVNFILSITSNTLLPETVYLILATAFYAPIHVLWMRVITELLYKDNQKKIMKFFWIEAVAYEIILVVMFLIDPALVGQQFAGRPFYAVFSDIVLGYFLFSLAVFLITGIIFSRFYMKSTNPEIRRKGVILLVAFISFLIGIALDNFVGEPTELTILIARLIHMTASLEFYFGFALRKNAQ